MQFELSEEQLMIQKAARDFAQQECLPGVIARDEQQKFPREQIMKLADLGFMGMMVSPNYGGSGLDTMSYVLAMEEISKIDASVSVCMSVNNSLVSWGLEAFGSEAQKTKISYSISARKKKTMNYTSAHFCLASRKPAVTPLPSEQRQKTKAIIIYSTALKKLDYKRLQRQRISRNSTNRCEQRLTWNQCIYSRKKFARCYSGRKRKQARHSRQRYTQHTFQRCKSAQRKPYWRRRLRF